MEIYIVVAVVLYWTFAVACVAIISASNYDNEVWMLIALAALWPALALIAVVALPYRAVVASAKTIRADLRNRKLLREFEQWLRDQDRLGD